MGKNIGPRTAWKRVDHRLFSTLWRITGTDAWLRVVIFLGFAALLFLTRASFAQAPSPSELQRQIDRIEREIETLRITNVDAAKIRQAGFERLSSLEAQVHLNAAQLNKLENYIYGTLAGLLANLAASLKAIGDLRGLRGGKRR